MCVLYLFCNKLPLLWIKYKSLSDDIVFKVTVPYSALKGVPKAQTNRTYEILLKWDCPYLDNFKLWSTLSLGL